MSKTCSERYQAYCTASITLESIHKMVGSTCFAQDGRPQDPLCVYRFNTQY